MNRPKRATSRRSSGGEKSAPVSPLQPSNWKDAAGSKPDNLFVDYAVNLKLARGVLVRHPEFGKGIVFEIEGNKAHILFEEGVRKLMHKGS